MNALYLYIKPCLRLLAAGISPRESTEPLHHPAEQQCAIRLFAQAKVFH